MRSLLSLLFLFALFANGQNMNNEELGKLLLKNSDSIEGRSGYWQFKKEDVLLICVTDENNNRMRIISPIAEVKNLENELLLYALKANYHTALDVKYAISDDILWSVFIHPLKELSPHQVEDAISQVYYANLTFGYTYSSTSLIFGAPKSEENNKEPETIKKRKKI